MTKKTVEEKTLDDGLAATPDVSEGTVDRWTRSDVLEKAITFHKNNGGMSQPTQVVATATVFLDFITGESK
jgi:hypothetical protein